jgi:hypothetical protein
VSTLTSAVLESLKVAKAAGWEDVNEIPFGEFIALCHTELSEAFEEYRNGRDYREIYYNPDKPTKPEGIPIELVDVLIRIFHFAGRKAINLQFAYDTKTAYNKTRPYRHGGKRA